MLKPRSLVIVVCLWLLIAVTASAWEGHEIITAISLQEIEGLDVILEKTEYTYDDIDQSEYNPEFKIKYIYQDKEYITALDVLIGYSSEPDWGLDTNLELSKWQSLTGGSQGYRHQRYATLWGLVTIGVAPERAQHFYDLALLAYEQGDYYWAYRFLARSLHYLQDMGQPLHALPLPLPQIAFRHKFNIEETTVVASNVHFNLEAFVAHQMREEYDYYTLVLGGDYYDEIEDVNKAAIELNNQVREKAGHQYVLVTMIWPDVLKDEPVTIDHSIKLEHYDRKSMFRLFDIIDETLEETARYSRGLIIKFLEDTGQL
ncbi:MAG: hypothetical protein GX020_02375 [Firmicutes bacterium]|nr:hypothetical protein [Bacillota bacterium]